MTNQEKICELIKAAQAALIVFKAFGMQNHPIADQIRLAIQNSSE